VTPVESQEVWAAGVTYLRSRDARIAESEFSASTYDRVYDAMRPEIFFKALPEKVVSPGEAVGIREDARWNVPEPELALVVNSYGSRSPVWAHSRTPWRWSDRSSRCHVRSSSTPICRSTPHARPKRSSTSKR
jgi:hypothetical protein